jgi:hypothetical protein
MFALHRFSLFSILLLAFLVGGTRMNAADNPPPCFDPWVCDFKPVITGVIGGPGSACHDETLTYSVLGSSSPGQRSHCNIREPVPAPPISWKWKLTGPEPEENGESDTFTRVFKGRGTYTITFTGSATAPVDSTCPSPDPVTVTREVYIEKASGTATLSDAQICPGSTTNVTWTITNTGYCTETFSWEATITNGDLPVILNPQKDSLTISPGITKSGSIQVSTALDGFGVSRTIHFAVSVPNVGEIAKADGHVTQPPASGTFAFGSPADLQGRPLGTNKFKPGSTFLLPYTTKNTGHCRDRFTDIITCSNQDVELINGDTLAADLASGQTRVFHVRVHIKESAKKGSAVFTGNAYARLSAVGYDSASIEILKCEASGAKLTNEVKFDLETLKIQPIIDKIDSLSKALEKLPGAVVVTPDKPKLSGKLKITTGEECCPGAADPANYVEKAGEFEVGLGATATWRFAIDPIVAVKLYGGKRQITGRLFAGIISSLKLEAAVNGSVTSHSGSCHNCATTVAKAALSLEGTIKVGAEASLDYVDYNGVESKVGVELTGTGALKGTLGSLEGTFSFGSDCPPSSPLTGCTGPVTGSIEIRAKGGFVSFKLLKLNYDIIGKHCYPETSS